MEATGVDGSITRCVLTGSSNVWVGEIEAKGVDGTLTRTLIACVVTGFSNTWVGWTLLGVVGIIATGVEEHPHFPTVYQNASYTTLTACQIQQ